MFLKLFICLMRWYCNTQVDQWEDWMVGTKYGPVYVSFSRENVNEVKRFDMLVAG
jgi:hypothetical protein